MPARAKASGIASQPGSDLPGGGWDDDEDQQGEFHPLSAEEARSWRQRHPADCLWCILAAQVAVGGVVAVLAGWLGGGVGAGWSAAYGALAVVLPTVFFLHRARRRVARPGAALLNLLVSELVKVVWIVIMLLLAPRLVPALSWQALLAGMLAVLVTYILVPFFAFARSPAGTGEETR